MFRLLLIVAIAAAFAAPPASAKLYKRKNDTQSVKSGGRGGKHYGQRYGRTSH